MNEKDALWHATQLLEHRLEVAINEERNTPEGHLLRPYLFQGIATDREALQILNGLYAGKAETASQSAEVQRLHLALNDVEAKYVSTKGALQRAEEGVHRHQGRIKELMDQVIALETQLEELGTETALKRRLENAHEAMANLDNELGRLHAELDSTTAQRNRLLEQLEKSAEERDTMADRISAWEETYANLEKEMKAVSIKFGKSQVACQKHRDDATRLLCERDAALKRVKELEQPAGEKVDLSTVDQLMERIRLLERENAMLRAQLPAQNFPGDVYKRGAL